MRIRVDWGNIVRRMPLSNVCGTLKDAGSVNATIISPRTRSQSSGRHEVEAGEALLVSTEM